MFFDKTGAAWTRELTPQGTQAALVDPLGNRAETTWNTTFDRLTQKDARNFTTTMTYDAQGNVKTITHPDTRVETFNYELTFNRMTQQTATGLPTVNLTYDASGRLKTRQDGLGTTTYNYDPRGQLFTVVQPGTGTPTTTFGYDAFGNTQTITDPTSRVTTLGYDPAGHLTSTRDGNNKTRTMEVDDAGRVTAMVSAKLERTEFTYDNEGSRLTSKDADNNVTTLAYDKLGRMTSATDALNQVTRTEYDAEGRTLATVDAKGKRATRKYDPAGHLTETTDALGFNARGSFVKLLDGGQFLFEEAPFSAIREWAQRLDAGTIILNGQTIQIRAAAEGEFALPIENGKLVESRVDSYVPLADVERCRQVLVSRSKRGLLLDPSPDTPGSDLLAVLDLAVDAGTRPVAFLRPLPPLSEAAQRAITLTIDSHVTEIRSCFGATTESLAKLVIGPKGRIVQVTIKKPSDDVRISKCVLERAKAWEFLAPVDGGVIVVNREFDFRYPVEKPDAGH